MVAAVTCMILIPGFHWDLGPKAGLVDVPDPLPSSPRDDEDKEDKKKMKKQKNFNTNQRR